MDHKMVPVRSAAFMTTPTAPTAHLSANFCTPACGLHRHRTLCTYLPLHNNIATALHTTFFRLLHTLYTCRTTQTLYIAYCTYQHCHRLTISLNIITVFYMPYSGSTRHCILHIVNINIIAI